MEFTRSVVKVSSLWVGIEHGVGARDTPAADGQGGHVSSHLLLTAAGWQHSRQLCRTQEYRRPQ